jgi:hypothetical protein
MLVAHAVGQRASTPIHPLNLAPSPKHGLFGAFIIASLGDKAIQTDLSLALPPLQDPVPGIAAHPLPTNLLEWHWVLEGAPGTDYEGGVYHGKICFPTHYPYVSIPPQLAQPA